MSARANGMEDIGGGVSIITPTKSHHEHHSDRAQKAAEEKYDAFLKLSEEIARVTQDVGDPMTVHPLDESEDPHLAYFLDNKKK